MARRWRCAALVRVAGIGQAMMGLIPEATELMPHLTGAGLCFRAGRLSLVLLGTQRRRMSWMLLLFGAVSLAATVWILASGLRVPGTDAV